MSLRDLVEALERYGFQCQGGSMRNCVEWRELRDRLGHPSPSITPDPDAIGASAYTRLLELEDDVQRREQGRVRLINALSTIAERSTSHDEAVRIARGQLHAAGNFIKSNPSVKAD
jgi:hypothetical protein